MEQPRSAPRHRHTVRPDFEAQGRWKALALQFSRLPADDDGNDTVGTAQDFKAANFFIDVFALHRIRRTNDDKESRGFQRGERVFARGVVGGKILAVAKYRPQFLRQSSSARLPTH